MRRLSSAPRSPPSACSPSSPARRRSPRRRPIPPRPRRLPRPPPRGAAAGRARAGPRRRADPGPPGGRGGAGRGEARPRGAGPGRAAEVHTGGEAGARPGRRRAGRRREARAGSRRGACSGRRPAPAPKPAATAHAKVGPQKCKMCHRVQHESWSASPHATNELDCEGCHGNGGDYWPVTVMRDGAKAIANGLVIRPWPPASSATPPPTPRFSPGARAQGEVRRSPSPRGPLASPRMRARAVTGPAQPAGGTPRSNEEGPRLRERSRRARPSDRARRRP